MRVDEESKPMTDGSGLPATSVGSDEWPFHRSMCRRQIENTAVFIVT
jgi:hypothetical protein